MVQCLGCIAGCIIGNGMFEQAAVSFDGKDREKPVMVAAEVRAAMSRHIASPLQDPRPPLSGKWATC